MTYCDSSFLVSLLIPGDFFYPHATAVAARFRESIPYTLLAELEVTNTLRRALREKQITRAEHDAAFRQIEADIAEGILERKDIPKASTTGKRANFPASTPHKSRRVPWTSCKRRQLCCWARIPFTPSMPASGSLPLRRD